MTWVIVPVIFSTPEENSFVYRLYLLIKNSFFVLVLGLRFSKWSNGLTWNTPYTIQCIFEVKLMSDSRLKTIFGSKMEDRASVGVDEQNRSRCPTLPCSLILLPCNGEIGKTPPKPRP